MISERERQLAFHSQLAMQVLTQSNEPITSDQLSLRMVALGGDKLYLKDNIAVLIEAMKQMGEIRGQRDGRYVSGTCFHDKNPTIIDQQPGSFVDKLRRLNLVTVDVQPGGKDEAGKSCTMTEIIHYTDVIRDLQGYYYSALGLALDHQRAPP